MHTNSAKLFNILAFSLLLIIPAFTNAQEKIDSIAAKQKVTRLNGEMRYNVGNGKTLVYSKPKKWAFITGLPKDAAGIASTAFSKSAIKPWAMIAGSTALLIWGDQVITDGVADFAKDIHVDPTERYNNVSMHVGGKDIALLRFPRNINTAFYQVGQGFPSLAIGVGIFVYGKTHHDYRALSTASQLAESFILMGVGTQIVKRITGRENPSDETQPRGKWQFFPSFSEYQNHTPKYDAFPSGHLATLMSTITILHENYPEKKWITPVGYSVSALVCLSMINNKVHWASDYPLALGMGYLCAKQVAKRGRRVETSTSAKKGKGNLDYTINYTNGVLTPGIVYTF